MSIVSRIRNFFSASDPASGKARPVPAASPVAGPDPFPRSLGNQILPLEDSHDEAEVQRRLKARVAAQYRNQRDVEARRLRDHAIRSSTTVQCLRHWSWRPRNPIASKTTGSTNTAGASRFATIRPRIPISRVITTRRLHQRTRRYRTVVPRRPSTEPRDQLIG
jgi:hypothetical protein